MTVVALDTLEIVKELKAAGFNEPQAEAVTRVVRKAQDLDLSHLATKADLEALRVATKVDIDSLRINIDSLRVSTKTDIDALKSFTNAALADTKADILKWMFGTVGFQTLVIVGAIVALTRAIA